MDHKDIFHIHEVGKNIFGSLKNDLHNKLWIKNVTAEQLICYLTSAVVLFRSKTQKTVGYCERSTRGMCSTLLWFKRVFCPLEHSLCWMYIPEVIAQLSKPQLGETTRQESDLSQKAHVLGILDIFVSWVNEALPHHHWVSFTFFLTNMNQDGPAGRHPGCSETDKQPHRVDMTPNVSRLFPVFYISIMRSWSLQLCSRATRASERLPCNVWTQTICSYYKSSKVKVRYLMSIWVPAQRFLMTHHCHHSRLTAHKQFRKNPVICMGQNFSMVLCHVIPPPSPSR